MPGFEAKRVRLEYTQTNDAPPNRVFPLLCPVREAEWLPRMALSDDLLTLRRR